jgi:ferric-dicitrate binding protein FerR (iron transport regulator)
MTDTVRTARMLAGLLRDTELDEGAGRANGRNLFRAAVVLRRRGRVRRRVAGAGALFLAAATFVGGWWMADLGESGSGAAGALASATLVTPADSTAQLQLADGARVELRPDSRLRLDESDGQVQANLASGAVVVDSPELSSRSWTLQAGPFVVRTEEGGKLAVAWAQGSGRLAVDLYEGEIEVQGPMEGGQLELRPGQRLRVDATNGRLSLTPLIEAEPLLASAQPLQARAAPAAAASALLPETTSGASAAAGGPRVSWNALVGKGDFDAVLRAAEARGVQACLSSCSSDDLYALSLAARYAGRAAVAQRGWRALRSRYAGSSRAAEAAFFLGRAAEGAGRHAQARRWYDTYLSEAPGGRYAAAALGGKMLATAGSSGKAAAAPIARAYLERYPNGVHADGARRILDSQ